MRQHGSSGKWTMLLQLLTRAMLFIACDIDLALFAEKSVLDHGMGHHTMELPQLALHGRHVLFVPSSIHLRAARLLKPLPDQVS